MSYSTTATPSLGSATVNFNINFRALTNWSLWAQGKDSIEDGVRGEGGRKEKPHPAVTGYATFRLRPTSAFRFVDSGSGIGMKSGSRAILFKSESNLRIVGTIAHLCG